MDHVIRAGTSALDGSGLELRTIYSANLIEYDWRGYDSKRVAETERDKWLVELGVEPPKPEMHAVRIVRCPQCGATDAGDVEDAFELARMSCGACGFVEWADDEEIKDDWNAEIEIRKDDRELPPFVAPLPPKRSGGFELRGGGVLVHRRAGYSITIPGDPWRAIVHGTDSAIFGGVRVWFEIVVRIQDYYFERTAEALARREIEDVVKRRAIPGTVPAIVTDPKWLRTSYPRPITDDPDETEVLYVSVKPGAKEHDWSAAFVTVRYAHHKGGRDAIDALCAELMASQRF